VVLEMAGTVCRAGGPTTMKIIGKKMRVMMDEVHHRFQLSSCCRRQELWVGYSTGHDLKGMDRIALSSSKNGL